MTDTPAPIVFLDTETSGLGRDDEIWEFAAVRRDWDGNALTSTTMHLFVEHDEKKCRRLPDAFREDHAARFPSPCSGRVDSRPAAADAMRDLFRPNEDDVRPVVVGINPGFDLGYISRLIATYRPHADAAPWDYTPVDARHLAVGAILAQPVRVMLGDTIADPMVGGGVLHVASEQAQAGHRLSGPPWGSEDVSRALGINPDDYDRHTAMGDVLWAMAIYDAVTNPTHPVPAKETTAP